LKPILKCTAGYILLLLFHFSVFILQNVKRSSNDEELLLPLALNQARRKNRKWLLTASL
jgi:hypothetical protein